MPSDDEQHRRRSARGRKHNERGRHFHRGMAQLRGETGKNGWRHEVTVELCRGVERRHDTARVNERGGRDFTEYKGGNRVGGERTADQLAKDREILTRDVNARGTWVLVQGAVSSTVRKELEALAHDFPGRFRIEEVTPARARQARTLGRNLERERNQLELVDGDALRSVQRARERAQRARDTARIRDAAQRAVERDERERRQEREERAREDERIREATCRALAQVEIERKAKEQREAAERLAAAAREAAARGERRAMSTREVADVLALSQPTPGVQSPNHHPHVQHRSNRVRERNSRERGLGRER
ncbi:hypothetical protein [Nocardia carnea]|uniref:hypothetical protein n=1 Tax=Nocardia carnea TaxID=37328 RepID=UPI0024545E84|nr:hypothetical protein [Nocardia carnea]